MSLWPGWETPWDGAGMVVTGETMNEGMGRAIRKLVATAMGFAGKDVRPENDGGPRGKPGETFATVHVTSTETQGWAESEIDAPGTTEAIRTPIRVTVSVNFWKGAPPKAATDPAGIARYTTAAFDMVERLPRRLQLTQLSEMMRGMGLGFIGASRARDLADTINAQWESRGQVDLYFSALSSENAAITTYGEIGEINTVVESPDGTQHTTTTEVSP
jgi:hypothetical protein